QGKVDLIVTNSPNSNLHYGQNVSEIHMFQDCFVANPVYYSELKDRAVSLKELLSYPILMLDKTSSTSEFLHALFQQNQLDLVPEFELDSNDLLIDLSRIGLGIAFVPDFCLPEDKNLFTLNIIEKLPKRKLIVAHTPQLPLTAAVKEFINLLHNEK
ncbi:MAG: LysR family transcriptional regulator substrate-binding protein, partial [Ruminococcus sp.]|nr:LysR family transcriptional regulator substrate-binding protein [Ruminococcus sp.]